MVINKIGNQLEEQALVAIKCTNQDLKQKANSATGRAPSATERPNKGDDVVVEPLGGEKWR